MAEFWTKLDSGLSTVYANWLEIRRLGASRVGWVHPGLRRGATGAHVSLRYEGSLAEIERAGFETTWTSDPPGRAYGIVRFETLERVGALPGVLKLTYGQEGSPRLTRSIPFVRADFVRTYEEPLTDWDGPAGRGAIIAILDTGVDIRHEFLQHPRAEGAERRSRILRIWDPGLDPVQAEERSPDRVLLGGRPTYGVVYTQEHIDDTLNGRDHPRVRHEDCSGHGTHVASIAAGNGGGRRRFVGMAPRADLIVVKSLYLRREPLADGAVVSPDQRFADAVDWVFNVVRTELGDRPVVINFSVGNELGPHDGLSPREEALEATLQAGARRVFVSAAGNARGHGSKSAMSVPLGATEIRIPFVLRDERSASGMTDYRYCEVRPNARNMFAEIWYAAPPPTPITGTLEIEGVPGAIPLPGLPFNTGMVEFGQGQRYKISHEQDFADVGSVRVRRNVIRLEIWPHRNRYHRTEARYVFRLTGAPGQRFFAWGHEAGVVASMLIDEDDAATASFTRASEIDSPAGAPSVIAVANYPIPHPELAVDSSTSRGPLVTYSNDYSPPAKPDIAAPGEDVTAARSRSATKPGFCVDLPRPDAVEVKSGTSMATPHVAGLVAMMFEVNQNLTRAQIRASFRVREGTPAGADDYGAGVIDANATIDAVPRA